MVSVRVLSAVFVAVATGVFVSVKISVNVPVAVTVKVGVAEKIVTVGVLEIVLVAVPAVIVIVKVVWAVPLGCSGEPGPVGLDFFLLHAENTLTAKTAARTRTIAFFIKASLISFTLPSLSAQAKYYEIMCPLKSEAAGQGQAVLAIIMFTLLRRISIRHTIFYYYSLF
jgi:hypothetical protein